MAHGCRLLEDPAAEVSAQRRLRLGRPNRPGQRHLRTARRRRCLSLECSGNTRQRHYRIHEGNGRQWKRRQWKRKVRQCLSREGSGSTSQRRCLSNEGSETTRRRRCLCNEGSGNSKAKAASHHRLVVLRRPAQPPLQHRPHSIHQRLGRPAAAAAAACLARRPSARRRFPSTGREGFRRGLRSPGTPSQHSGCTRLTQKTPGWSGDLEFRGSRPGHSTRTPLLKRGLEWWISQVIIVQKRLMC